MGVVAALMTACWALSKIAPGAMIGLAEAAAFVVELAALIAVMTAFCLTRRYRREKGKASNRDRSS